MKIFIFFPCGLAGKKSACNLGDLGSFPGLGRSSGEGKGYPLQYSSLENSKDSPWGCKESNTTERLSLSLSLSSILAWKIPWTEEPGRLYSIGSHRVRHDWSNAARTHVCSSFYWPYFQSELSSLLALLHVSRQTEMTYTVTGSPLPVASFPRTQQPALSELWCQQNTWIPCCYKCRPCNWCHVHRLSVTNERWNASQCGIWWGYRTSVIFRLTGS